MTRDICNENNYFFQDYYHPKFGIPERQVTNCGPQLPLLHSMISVIPGESDVYEAQSKSYVQTDGSADETKG